MRKRPAKFIEMDDTDGHEHRPTKSSRRHEERGIVADHADVDDACDSQMVISDVRSIAPTAHGAGSAMEREAETGVVLERGSSTKNAKKVRMDAGSVFTVLLVSPLAYLRYVIVYLIIYLYI